MFNYSIFKITVVSGTSVTSYQTVFTINKKLLEINEKKRPKTQYGKENDQTIHVFFKKWL